jgi:uncharacterized RDD family membrane protein YckC
MLDTIHPVETPEGVRLALRSAGPVPRALAFGLDAAIRGALYTTALIALSVSVPQLTVALFTLLLFVGEWFYPVLFEVLGDGQTIGKRVVGLRVVNDDGTPIGWSASILRNLLLAADALPGTYAAGLVSMCASRGFRRLGDHAAGTLVVHAERPAPVAVSGGPTRAPLAPPIPLALDEQRAVIAFCERAAGFSDDRAEELARLATPLQAPGESARLRVERIGAWLLGRESGPPR